jgi:hypothetical protein
MTSLLILTALLVTAPAQGPAEADGLKVLVLEPTGDAPTGVKTAVRATLVTEIGGLDGFHAVSTQELAAVMGVEAEKQAFGCDESSCLTEVASALDADLVVVTQLSGLAGTFLISVSAFASSTTSIVSASQVRATTETEVPYVVVSGLEPLLSPLVSLGDRKALGDALAARAAVVRDRDTSPSELKQAIGEAAQEAVEEKAAETGAAAGEKAAEALLAKALRERAEVRFGPQSGPKVFMSQPTFAGVDASLRAGLLATMAEAAQKEGLSVMTSDDVKDLLSRAADQASLGVDDNADNAKAFAALGDVMGVQHLVSVTFTRDREDTLVQARLINAELAEVVNRREVRASRWGGSVPEAAKVAIRVVLAPVFGHLKGTVNLSVTEEGASVLVDDEIIGTTPLEGPLDLPGGTHVIGVSKEGFIRFEETVKITKGTALTRDVTLRPSPDFVTAHKVKAYTFAALTSGMALLSVPFFLGAAAGVGGWVYTGVAAAQVTNDWNAKPAAERVDTIPDPNNPSLTVPNPEYVAFQQQLADFAFAGQISSIIGGLLVLVGAGAAVIAVATAFFIENPWKYDDLVAEPEE